MVKSIIEGVADFFKDCPLLNAGVFRVDALGDEPQEYTIETGIFNPIIETYIDGSSDRRYQFNFGSREYYSMDRLQNIANSTFYEDFANWVEDQEAAGNFPELPEGMHPRHAIGFMIGYTLAILRSAGCPDVSERIRSFIPSLRGFRDTVSADDGQARALAGLFRGRVPVVCADSSMASVAFRWKTQINENSKFVAFCESAPLFNAHAMKGWAAAPEDYILVLLNGTRDSAATPDLGRAFTSLEGWKGDIVMVGLMGESHLENMFRAIILGDYISMYMAEDRGIDPAEVRPVMQMKAKLSERLG